jgi:hypothetical protein
MVRLIIQYYKSLLLMNVIISICLGLMSLIIGKYGFPICFMTGGYVLSILYYELSKQKQYYFYFNKGLSKQTLYITSFIINTILGIIIVLLIKLSWIY